MADLANLRISVDSREVKTAAVELNSLSGAAAGASKGLKLLGIASAAVGLASVVKAAVEFQTAMAEVSTLVDTAKVSMIELNKTALEQAQLFGSAPVEQAKALYQVISAGATTAAQASNVLTAANKLAIGGVTDVTTAADGLTTAMNAFGAAAGTSTNVSDAMFVAMKAGKTTIGQLSSSMSTVAPIAAQMGASIDDVLAATAALTKGGMPTTVAMNGLRASMVAVLKPTKEASDLAEQLGIKLGSTAFEGIGFSGFLDQVKEKTKGSADQMAVLFGGIEGLNPVLALTGKAAFDYSSTLADMALKAGMTEEAFTKMTNSPGFKIDKLLANISVLAIQLGNNLLTLLIPAIDFFNNNLGLIVNVLGVAAIAFGTYTAAMLVTNIAKTLMVKNLIAVISLTAAETASLGGLAGAQAFVSLTTGGLTASFNKLTLAMMRNPITLVAVALAGLATYLFLTRNATEELTAAQKRQAGVSKILDGISSELTEETSILATAQGAARAESLAHTKALLRQANAALTAASAEAILASALAFRTAQEAKAAIPKTGGSKTFRENTAQARFARKTAEEAEKAAFTASQTWLAAEETVAGYRRQIEEATNPVKILTATVGDMGDAKKNSAKATQAATDALKEYYDGLVETGRYIGINNEYEIQADKARRAGRDALAAQIIEQGKLNEINKKADEDKKSAAEFGKTTLANLLFENSLIGESVRERERLIAVRELDNAKVLEGSEAYIAYQAAVASGSEAKVLDDQKKRVDALREEITLMGLSGDAAILQAAKFSALAAGLQEGSDAYEKFIATATEEAGLKKIEDGLKAIKDAMQEVKDMTFDIDLAGVFGNIGKAVGGLVNVFDDYAKRQKTLDTALKGYAKGDARRNDAELKSFRNQINLYGNLASSAKGFFKEKSVGYKVMQAAETAFRAFEFAMSIKAMAMKSTEAAVTVATAGVEAAANTTAGASKMFSQVGIYAFPIVAAMIAVLASLGGKGGSVTSPSIPTAEEMQAAQGAGGVLGDATAKSNSINNALDIMASNSNENLEYSNKMLMSLRSIQTNMANLANNVAKQISVSGGMFDTSAQRLGSTGSGGVLGMFGSSTTRELYDLGIEIVSSSIAEIIAGGISGQTYQVVQQVKKKSGFFGIGGGTKTTYQTTTGSIDQQVQDSITGVIASLRQGLIDGADVIGLQGAQAILDSFQVNIGKISLSGLTGQEIEEQLNAIFSKVGDEMAGALLPSLSEMQHIGEGLFETFARVARQYQVVDVALLSIGKEFGSVGLSSLAARDALVQLFESLDQFVEQTGYFRDNFLTEAEQIAPIAKAVGDELQRLGLSSITTLEQFKLAVLGLDLTSVSGREAYAALLQLAPAFKTVIDYQEQLTEKQISDAKAIADAAATAAKAVQDLQNKRVSMEIQLMEALGQSTEALAARRELELAALDDTLRALQLQIYAAQDAKAATDAASAAAKTAADELAKQLEATSRLANSRRELEIQLLEAQGFAVEALAQRRAMELEVIDASLVSLKEQIWAAQAKAEADAEAAKIAEEAVKAQADAVQDAANAMQQYQDALASVTETVMDEINRLRGINAASSSSLLKAQFAMLTAQARTGNLDALGKLPELSRSIEEVTLGTATSALEVARIKAWLDASLSETLSLANASGDTVNATSSELTFDGNSTASANADQTSGELSNMSNVLYNALYQVARNTGKSYDLLDRWDGDGLPDIREDASDYY